MHKYDSLFKFLLYASQTNFIKFKLAWFENVPGFLDQLIQCELRV